MLTFHVWPQNHMLWVLRRTFSMRGFPWVPETHVWTNAQENIHFFPIWHQKSHMGTQRNRLSETIPISSQTIYQNQCTWSIHHLCKLSLSCDKNHMYICRCSKEPSRRDNSHEFPKDIFKPMHKRTSIACAYFLYLATEIICCGYPKEPSVWDNYHEYPKHMSKQMHKKTSINCAYSSNLSTKITCCGYSKESSRWDDSNELPRHMS